MNNSFATQHPELVCEWSERRVRYSAQPVHQMTMVEDAAPFTGSKNKKA